MSNKSPEELYRQGREVLEELAPMVSQNGMGKKFAELVDLVDLLKPMEVPAADPLPEGLRGPLARTALTILQLRFRKAVGMNVFDMQTEEIVRATWNLVSAIVQDKNEELEDVYRNSGAGSTPDWDVVTELVDRTETPESLHALLWGVRPRGGK